MPHPDPAEASPARKNSPREPNQPQPLAASHEELQWRRREINRGLRRSHYAVVAASGMVGLFALAALWLSGEARQRAEDARRASTRLWQFSSHAARLERLTRTSGQRVRTVEMIAEAARFQPSRELRDEALSGTIGQHDAGGPMTGGSFSLMGGFWALPTAVQVTNAPTLTIALGIPGQARISWAPNTPRFVLQEASILAPANWSNSPSGATNSVVVSALLPMKFYRLCKP